MRLGRRDSTTASRSLADSDIPRATTSLANLIGMFNGKGLSERDMVALSGVCLNKNMNSSNNFLGLNIYLNTRMYCRQSLTKDFILIQDHIQ